MRHTSEDDDYYEEPETEFCNECCDNVVPEVEDHGIGSYEYWGHKGVHTDLVYTCPNCGNEL